MDNKFNRLLNWNTLGWVGVFGIAVLIVLVFVRKLVGVEM